MDDEGENYPDPGRLKKKKKKNLSSLATTYQ